MRKRMVLLGVAVLLATTAPISAQEEMYADRRQELMSSLDGGFAVLFSDARPGRFNKPFFYPIF